ncbi:family 20 glycosylhydrolase [Pedobacter sp. JCM 36344]|uniref:family 20 glycosylhydrolase n=1 Tax=Pedobacter sp. JCM 36344 TaxID=3374280 RepID=UPI00397911CE
MKKSLLFILVLILTKVSYSQKRSSFDARGLKVSWETVENNYKETKETYSKLTLTNISKEFFPASGWTLYFNAPNLKSLNETGGSVKVELINGDFFKARPERIFKGLGSGKSIVIPLLSRDLIKRTDFPRGFYVVFSSRPSNAIPVIYEALTAIDYSRQQQLIAEKNYQENDEIEDIPLSLLPPIFPSPSSIKNTKDIFNLNKLTKIITDPAFGPEAAYLNDEFEKLFTFKPLPGTTEKQNVIILQKLSLPSKEAYKLQVTSNEIIIGASGKEGLFYGIQSLKNLFPISIWSTKQDAIAIPGISVSDAPRFPHRAFMMDIARNFQGKKAILKVIEMISFYKLNVLHLHLNDDEGWRIEIPGLPELTDVGSKRGHTLNEQENLIPSYGSGPTVNANSGSGFLTRADYLEILEYATIRHVEVIPEFETPGHARAAIKSMDARYEKLLKSGDKTGAEQYLLRDLNDASVYRSVQGWNDNVINPALPSVYKFIEKLADEMIAVYKEAGAPLNTIHFGGDEVPAGVWEKSPAVANLLKIDASVTSVDEVWNYYFKNVNRILKARNLFLSGWEEIGLKKEMVNGQKQMVLDPRFAGENFHANVWNNLNPNEDLAYKLANAGYKVILTNVTNMYIDLAYNKNFEEPGQYWGGFVDVDKLFRFNPFKLDQPANKEVLTEKGKRNIIGLQAPLWSEIITTEGQLEYLMLPKLLGLAERSWSPTPDWATQTDVKKVSSSYQYAWSEFLNVIAKKELPRLDSYAGGFRYRIPMPGLIMEEGKVLANVQLPGFEIRYTTDGTEPGKSSKLYVEPVADAKNLSFRVFNASGRGGKTIKFLNGEKEGVK